MYDDNLGRVRPSKAAFDDHPNGSPMSVLLAELVLAAGREPKDVLIDRGQFALVQFSAGVARSKQLGVAKDPLPAKDSLPEEPVHAVVFGKKTASVMRALAKASQWVIPPPDGEPV